MATIDDIDDSHEIWRPVVGAEGLYDVSNWGRVRSLPRTTNRPERHTVYEDRASHIKRAHTLTVAGKIMTWTPNGGYPRVTLRIAGKTKYAFCHSLVAAAFLGPMPAGQEVRHKDGDRGNPRLGNLEYGTRAQNIADAKRHGTFCSEERRSQAKLTADQASAIAKAEGSLSSIGRQFGISPSVVRQIKTGATWKNATNGSLKPYVSKKRNRLTSVVVKDIYASTDRAVDIAERYNVSVDTVYSIKTGRFHTRITGHVRPDRTQT